MNNEFIPYRPDVPVRRYRRSLPHWRQKGCSYFVTFRTADSLPSERWVELKAELAILRRASPTVLNRHDRLEQIRLQKLFDKWLEAGYGRCPFRSPEAAQLVAGSLCFFDGQRYVLDEFVVMPNHVHTIVLPFDDYPLESILQSRNS